MQASCSCGPLLQTGAVQGQLSAETAKDQLPALTPALDIALSFGCSCVGPRYAHNHAFCNVLFDQGSLHAEQQSYLQERPLCWIREVLNKVI